MSLTTVSSSSAGSRKRIRNEEEQQNTDITLPNELWIRAFTYLDQKDLFLIANVNRNFLSLSSNDSIWKVLCYRRWADGRRFNVSRFARRDNCDDSERELNDGRVEYCASLLRQFRRSQVQNASCKGFSNIVHWDLIPPLNINESERHEPNSWKESYIMAEIDSRRTVLSREELIQIQWHSGHMIEGQFNEDGTYYVPDLKEMYKWVLRGNMLTVMGMEFMVEKDASTWGWLIRRFPYPNVDDDDDDDDNPYGRIFFYSVGDEEDDD